MVKQRQGDVFDPWLADAQASAVARTSPELMCGIMSLGWTFLFRVTRQSKIILPGGSDVTFYERVQHPGETYHAEDVVFKKRGRVPAGVRVVWGRRPRNGGPW